MSMSVEQTTCEDLKAFERRLTEVIASVQPATRRWRISLGTVFICVAIGACYWLQDPDLYKTSLFHSLFKHPLFSVSALILVCMLLLGGHKKIMTPMIIASRARSVLVEFNMSCDDNGKLILRPRPFRTRSQSFGNKTQRSALVYNHTSYMESEPLRK